MFVLTQHLHHWQDAKRGEFYAGYTLCHRLNVQVGRVLANGLRVLGSIPYRAIPKTLKMVLYTALLTHSNIRYVPRVKWSNPGKGVTPFPTPRCSSYWKGSLLVTLDYGRQLYLLSYTWFEFKVSCRTNNNAGWERRHRFMPFLMSLA